MNDKYIKKIDVIKILLFVVLVIIVSVIINRIGFSSFDTVKSIILKYENLSEVVYILLFAILPTFFAPVVVLAMAAGFVFGFVKASVYTFIGAFFNCTLTYFVSKYISFDFLKIAINTKYKEVFDKFNEKLSGGEGFIFMIALRLLPLIPYTLLNYMSGAIGFKYSTFIFSSLLGIIPGLLAYVNLGANMNNVGTKKFYVAIVLFVALVLVATIIGNKLYGADFLKKKNENK